MGRALHTTMRAWVVIAGLAGCAPAVRSVIVQPPVVATAVAPVVRESPAAEPDVVVPVVLRGTPPVRPLANFGVIARDSDSDLWWAFDGGWIMSPLDRETAAALGATRSLRVPRRYAGYEPWAWLADVALLRDWGHERIVAVDPRTLTQRWRVDRTYMAMATEQALLVADSQETLVARSWDSGREVWRVSDGVNLLHVNAVGERMLASEFPGVHSDGSRGVHAYDLATGAPAWTQAMDWDCGWTVGEGVLVVESTAGYRVIDPASGAVVRTIGGPGRCGWRRFDGPWFVTGIVGGGALVVVEPRVTVPGERVAPTELRSYDLATGTLRWSVPRAGLRVVGAMQDMVIAVREPGVLVALDAASGATRAEVSLGYTAADRAAYHVALAPEGGASGPLVFVRGHASEWVLGRRSDPTVPEAYELRGRVRSDRRLARKAFDGLAIAVGGQEVRTDASGRFVARGAAIGVVPVTLGPSSTLADRVTTLIDGGVVVGVVPGRPGLLSAQGQWWSVRDERVALDGSRVYEVVLTPVVLNLPRAWAR